ncbi:hypothetical protein VTK56DRAFT_4987 [Thermocarpiscus australiensis]
MHSNILLHTPTRHEELVGNAQSRGGRDIRAVQRVCRRPLAKIKDALEDDFTVFFHSDGAFSKLYRVASAYGQFIMRVSLPADPRNKTPGEAATLQLVRRETDIPVPAVVAFDDTRSNEIGFEWLLMDMMPGTPAYYHWRKMSMAQKEMLTAQVTDFQAQLLRCGNAGGGSRGIGTLGAGPDLDCATAYHLPEPEAKTNDDKEYAESTLRVARKLLRMLHKIFPAIVNPPERTVIWHDELSLRNMMVDANGAITAVMGWQCVSTMPRRVASQVPQFLPGAVREVKPDRNRYTDVSDKGSDVSSEEAHDSLDNEAKTELYWIHLMEYEQTQLRKVYASRMRQVTPEWDMEVEESALKVDFLGAVRRCDSGFYLRRIEQWVDAIERKEFLPLMEALRAGIKKEKTTKSNPNPQAGDVRLTDIVP